MTEILLVRHGQSVWNATGRWQGQEDPPLSQLGLAQARSAADSVGTFDLVAASDLQRASKTAEILAAASGIGPVLVDEDLRERHAGPWQGMTKAEIEVEYPGYLAADKRPEGYENDESVGRRAYAALKKIHEICPDGTALVVAHAGVVYSLEGMLGFGFKRLPNLSGRWFTLTDTEFSLGDRVDLVDPDKVESTIPDAI